MKNSRQKIEPRTTMDASDKAPEALLAQIAKEKLHFDTLEERGSDGLDFREVAVWSVKAALEAAYAAGRASVKR